MNKSYPKGHQIAAFLPAIELLERSREIAEGAIVEIGRLTLETVLGMSAMEIAGEPQRGRKNGDVRHHGSQPGNVKIGGKRVQGPPQAQKPGMAGKWPCRPTRRSRRIRPERHGSQKRS